MCSFLAALGGSTALSAAGSIMQGQAQGRVADYNAKVMQGSAATAQREGLAEEQRVRRLNLRRQGAQVAAIGASGLTGQGSGGDLLADGAVQMEMDALAARYGGERQATYYQAGAAGQRMQASAYRQGGWWGAGSSLLDGASAWALRYGMG